MISTFVSVFWTIFLCFYERNDHLTPLAIWKLPINHHWVVVWLTVLDANCPVLLPRGGIPRKALQHSGSNSSTEVNTRFTIHLILARRNSILFCLLLWALHGTSWYSLLLCPSRAQMTLSCNYGRCRYLHHCKTTQGSSQADDFYFCLLLSQ